MASKKNNLKKNNKPEAAATAAQHGHKFAARSSRQIFKIRKKMKHQGPKIPGSFTLFKNCITHLWTYKKVFIGIGTVYLLLTLFFVRGFTLTTDIPAIKDVAQETLNAGNLSASFSTLGVLLGSSTAASQVSSVYQTIVIILASLAVIWALRQTHAAEVVKVKDAFYKSTYPLTQFLIVVVIIGLQMLPLIASGFLYSATIASGLATSALEVMLWLIVTALLIAWTLYMLAVSVFGLYIVTLPDVTPLQSLKSAKGLVKFRRATVLRKLLFLPFALILLLVAIMVPIIAVIPFAAEALFILLSVASLIIAHSYVYTLYRELLA